MITEISRDTSPVVSYGKVFVLTLSGREKDWGIMAGK